MDSGKGLAIYFIGIQKLQAVNDIIIGAARVIVPENIYREFYAGAGVFLHLHHRPKRRYCFFGSRNRHTCSAIHRVPDPFRQLSRPSSFRWICRNRPQPQSNPVPIRLRLHVKMMPKSAPERQKQLTLMSDITLCALQYSLQNIQISNSRLLIYI